MTVNELKDYFTRLADNGHSDALVMVANKSWNPLTDGDDICDCILLNWKDGESTVVLQTE